MSKGYIINKDNNSKEISYIEYETKTGYNIKPKNLIKKTDSIDVSKVIFLYPSFIEKIINKKIDKKYKQIISMVSKIATDDESDDTGFLIGTFNEIERFRSILKRKYSKFLEEKQMENIERKLKIMEKEIKKRINEIEEYNKELTERQGKSR